MKQELGAVDDGDMFGAPVAVAANDFAIPAAADDFGGFDASEPASFGETGGDVAFEAAAATPVDAVTGSMAAMSTASVVLSSVGPYVMLLLSFSRRAPFDLIQAKSTNALAPDVDSDAVR